MAALFAIGVSVSCRKETKPPPPPAVPVKRFPSPIYDGLALGMTRAQATRLHAMRPSLTSSGRNLRVWVYTGRDGETVHLTFAGRDSDDPLRRIDVHFGPNRGGAEVYIDRFEKLLGEPDVRRRQADINAYGDRAHDQYDTIWSDDTQYVFLTERVPRKGHIGKPVYYLTVRRKQLSATGPPTGYVPPPAVDKDGNPIEEPVF
jgi:hypothetical protein